MLFKHEKRQDNVFWVTECLFVNAKICDPVPESVHNEKNWQVLGGEYVKGILKRSDYLVCFNNQVTIWYLKLFSLLLI